MGRQRTLEHSDTLIAATALEHGLTIVTTDTDLQCVPGLNVMIMATR